jgi:hypothetical protein
MALVVEGYNRMLVALVGLVVEGYNRMLAALVELAAVLRHTQQALHRWVMVS